MLGSWRFGFKKLRRLLLATLALPLLGCTDNLLTDFANPNTEEALLYQAKKLMNDGEWTSAIDLFSQMSATTLAQREVKFYQSSAYAGRCGYDFLNLLDALQNMGGDALFEFFMGAFPGSGASEVADCIAAEVLLNSVASGASQRSMKENLFMVFLSLAKVGVILSYRADSDDDGTADAGFDSCDTNDLPDAEARQLVSAVANINLSLVSLASSGSSIGQSETSALDTVCSALGALPQYDICSATDAAAVTTDQLIGMRTLLKSSDIALGPCTDVANAFTPTPVGCLCP